MGICTTILGLLCHSLVHSYRYAAKDTYCPLRLCVKQQKEKETF